MSEIPPTHLADDAGLTRQIIGLAINIHRHFGPGLMESIYETCLHHDLLKAGLTAKRQVSLPLTYDGLTLRGDYRADIIVEQSVILEIKSIEQIVPLHTSQLLTYLRLSGCRTGLLMNFNSVTLKDGLRRVVL